MAPQLIAPFLMPGPAIPPLNFTALRLNSSKFSENKTRFHHGPATIETVPVSIHRAEEQDTVIVHESFSAVYRKFRWFLGHRIPSYQLNDTNQTQQIQDKHHLGIEELPGSNQQMSEEDVIVYTAKDSQLHEAPVEKLSNSTAQLQIGPQNNKIEQTSVDRGLSASQIDAAVIAARDSTVESARVPLEFGKKFRKEIKNLSDRRHKKFIWYDTLWSFNHEMLREAEEHYTQSDRARYGAFITFSEEFDKTLNILRRLLELIPVQKKHKLQGQLKIKECDELEGVWDKFAVVSNAIEDRVIFSDELTLPTSGKEMFMRKGWRELYAWTWKGCLSESQYEERIRKINQVALKGRTPDSDGTTTNADRIRIEFSRRFNNSIRKFNKRKTINAYTLRWFIEHMMQEAELHRRRASHASPAWRAFYEFAKRIYKSGIIVTNLTSNVGPLEDAGDCRLLEQNWGNVFVLADVVRDGKVYVDELGATGNDTMLIKEKRWHKIYRHGLKFCSVDHRAYALLDSRALDLDTGSTMTSSASEDDQSQNSTSVHGETVKTPIDSDSTDDEDKSDDFGELDGLFLASIVISCLTLMTLCLIWKVSICRRYTSQSKISQQPVLPGVSKSPKEMSSADIC